MPAAKGKLAISVVMPEGLVAQLDQEASAQGMDRSSLIVSKLEAAERDGPWTKVIIRLDSQDRTIAQLVTALQEVLEAMRQTQTKTMTPAYPAPATLEETYPELYAPKGPDSEPVVAPPVDEKKGWARWRR